LFNDLSLGQYDVQVTVGTSQGTKRQQTVNFLLELARAYPPVVPMIGDLLAKSLDFDDAPELQRRLQMMMQMMQAQMTGGQPTGPGGPAGPGGPTPGGAPNAAMDEFGNQQSQMTI
jgi:hypothetical protein